MASDYVAVSLINYLLFLDMDAGKGITETCHKMYSEFPLGVGIIFFLNIILC